MLKPRFLIASWLAPLCFAAGLLADSCGAADEGGCDEAQAIDSSVPDPERQARLVPAHVRSQMETLEGESLRDSLHNLSDTSPFWWSDMFFRDGGGPTKFPLPRGEGRYDIERIMRNKRVLKLLKELGDLPKAEAGALVQEHLMAALSKYKSAFHRVYGPGNIGAPPRIVRPGESVEKGPSLDSRYEILSLALIAGHLELESAFPAVLELALYAREQREYLYQCYLTDKIAEWKAYYALVDASLYNRLVICTALLRTRGAEREAAWAERPRGLGIRFTTKKFPSYDGFLRPQESYDFTVGPGYWVPTYIGPTIELTFLRSSTDGYLDSILFDSILAEVVK